VGGGGGEKVSNNLLIINDFVKGEREKGHRKVRKGRESWEKKVDSIRLWEGGRTQAQEACERRKRTSAHDAHRVASGGGGTVKKRKRGRRTNLKKWYRGQVRAHNEGKGNNEEGGKDVLNETGGVKDEEEEATKFES